ncbi:MAG: multiheme c-type cytochrome [Candidatus Thiodiazotropha sp.]
MDSTPGYQTSAACADCHQQQFDAWVDSHHAWAWREPVPENVLGDFNQAKFRHAGFTYQFLKKNNEYFVVADDPSGKTTQYKVDSVAGVSPLQQYLLDIGDGRLQALDIAWDTVNKRWYHLYPDQDTSAGNGMHWTGSYKNWNSRCAECHATDYRKNYDPLKDNYNSQQVEIGVGCEACHGPGEAHIAWARAPGDFKIGHWKGIGVKGLTETYLDSNPSSEINLCAACHSRREPIGANSPKPGSHFDNHYRLALIRDGLYFSDGQIHDEVYVYGSFLQSKMYGKGVKCTNCHDAHSYQLKAKGNELCTQCHNSAGNIQFPTLIKKDYDSSSHHFHEAGTEGAECKQCHMPERNYMIVDGRRDHSFRIPRPDLTTKLGTPNACNSCHKDKSAEWAEAELVKRFPKNNQRTGGFAEVFYAADKELSDKSVDQLISLANNQTIPAIVRASALQRLLPVASGLDLDLIDDLLKDRNPWVRTIAANLSVISSDEDKQKKLLPLLHDPVRSVRLEAVKGFLNINLEEAPFAAGEAVQKTMKEYQQSLISKADFPEIQLVIGGIALTTKNIPAAIKAFQKAVEMDPQLIQAWGMLARIHAATGNATLSKQSLLTALKNNPGNTYIKQLLDEM